jgi:Hg(II)-responsive transcriptional regulator
MERGLRIGELAQRAGVNVQTLRFYERRGLMKEPPRRASGYREYATQSVQLVRFIKQAQGVGFSLQEIEQLLRLREHRQASCAEVLELAKAKLTCLDEKIRTLQGMRETLHALVEACPADRSMPCPIVESLGETATSSRARQHRR